MRAQADPPQWRQEIEAEIGEDPGQYLDADLLMNEATRELFEARLRGIDRLEVVARWLEVEHRLDRPECPRSSVVEKLEQRGRRLKDHGERPRFEDPGPDEPIHTGGDPNDPPPKEPDRVAVSRLAVGAARYYHYITKAKPHLKARNEGGGHA